MTKPSNLTPEVQGEPARLPPALQADIPNISAEDIEVLVHTFYARIQEDAELGPIFGARIEQWDEHLRRMTAFWRTVLRHEDAYHAPASGSPRFLHQQIAELKLTHLSQWLRLFEATARNVLDEDQAQFVLGRAERIGRALTAHLQA